MTEIKQANLWNTPLYYDVAFSWDPNDEIDTFEKIFKRHVPFPVKRILEPACGTGRFLVAIPKRGYYIHGYDNSPEMVEYSAERIKKDGIPHMASVEIADMSQARYRNKFDAAINVVNSIGYMLDDNDIVSHLKNTGLSLKKNAVYILQISTVFKDLENTTPERWTQKKFGIKIKTVWTITEENMETRKCHQHCVMKINNRGREFIHEEDQTMRLWTVDDILDIVKKSGKFTLEAIYDETPRKIPIRSNIFGEKGNLYYVLKRI